MVCLEIVLKTKYIFFALGCGSVVQWYSIPLQMERSVVIFRSLPSSLYCVTCRKTLDV